MSFPTNFPKQAVAELLSLALSSDKPASGTVALAVYDLLGFGLSKFFPGAVYPIGALNISQIEKVLNLPTFQNMGSVLTEFQGLLAGGKSKLQAVLALTLKYGPTIAETVLEILSITGA